MTSDNGRFICGNLGVSADGRLLFAGADVCALAEKYGTPLYLMDEDRIRERCRVYKNAASAAFGGRAEILYASKAASFKRIYEIMASENMWTDVVSAGEIRTAEKAGFPLEHAVFHSNGKTDADIAYAMDRGVGYFAVDNEDELFAVDREAASRNAKQRILLRITPGIDPHTYAAVATGKVDSKFGSAVGTGAAESITVKALSCGNVELCGFHCHVGSQIFDSSVYIAAARVMLHFISDMKKKYGYEAGILDIGGGFGVRYVASQPVIDIAARIGDVASFVTGECARLGITVPEIFFEPGRSIVADAGLTAYTVESVKRIPDYRNYVAVDGGMTDNIRYALYGAPYTILCADDVNAACTMECTVAGRCCESGDIIQEHVMLPGDICRGRILACLTTGAYHYSMASNYNRIGRPPVVMISGGADYTAVRRETPDDLVDLDV